LVIHDTLIIPQKKTAVLLFGKIAAFFLGNFFLQPHTLLGYDKLFYFAFAEATKDLSSSSGI